MLFITRPVDMPVCHIATFAFFPLWKKRSLRAGNCKSFFKRQIVCIPFYRADIRTVQKSADANETIDNRMEYTTQFVWNITCAVWNTLI